MFEGIMKFFNKVRKKEEKIASNSKDTAKERLHLVLMQDRANVSADFLELMKQEIIEVIKKYIDIDEGAIDVRLTNKENEDGTNGAPALYANIPILNIKNDARKIEKTKETDNESENKKEENKENKNNSEKKNENNKEQTSEEQNVEEKENKEISKENTEESEKNQEKSKDNENEEEKIDDKSMENQNLNKENKSEKQNQNREKESKNNYKKQKSNKQYKKKEKNKD